jgi:flagellar biosynthetic protein FliQ
MTQDSVTSLIVDAMGVTIKIAAPLLLAGLIIGLAVSVFQAVTQIQEQTLTFIPKIAALVAVIAIAGPWMLGTIVDWSHDLWAGIPQTVDFKPVGGAQPQATPTPNGP